MGEKRQSKQSPSGAAYLVQGRKHRVSGINVARIRGLASYLGKQAHSLSCGLLACRLHSQACTADGQFKLDGSLNQKLQQPAGGGQTADAFFVGAVEAE